MKKNKDRARNKKKGAATVIDVESVREISRRGKRREKHSVVVMNLDGTIYERAPGSTFMLFYLIVCLLLIPDDFLEAFLVHSSSVAVFE